MTETNCQRCGKKFRVREARLVVGWGKFCSNTCQYIAAIKRVDVCCSVCNKPIKRTPSKIEHSKSKKYFCSKSCQTIWRNQYYSGAKHLLWKGGFHVKYRKILLSTAKTETCLYCATKDRRVLVVHHVDKDRSNNKISNLEWLCHNCHYRVHHTQIALSIFMNLRERGQTAKNLL